MKMLINEEDSKKILAFLFYWMYDLHHYCDVSLSLYGLTI